MDVKDAYAHLRQQAMLAAQAADQLAWDSRAHADRERERVAGEAREIHQQRAIDRARAETERSANIAAGDAYVAELRAERLWIKRALARPSWPSVGALMATAAAIVAIIFRMIAW